MEVKDWIELLKQVGFPVLVALWFMLRSDKRQDAHTVAIDQLKDAINKLGEKL